MQAEEFYAGIRKNMAEATTKRRIYSIKYNYHGAEYQSTVGEQDPLNNELVAAIFKAPPFYLICTTDRGVLRGTPAIIGTHDAIEVIDFDL